MLERIVAAPFFVTRPTLVSLPPDGWFDRELLALVEKIQSASAERPYSLTLQTLTLIASVIEHTRTFGTADAHNVAIRKATLHIGHHLPEVLDFTELSKKFDMSYSLFRKRFRDYTGLAPLEYQNALRIRRASHLLTSSDAPVARIAEELGFQSPAYFARFFHRETGQSPVSYRRGVKP